MTDTPQAVYTALHGSLAVCEWCETPFTPRVLNGPNADRFCKTICKDAWHNERRRSAIKNPPSVAAEAGGMVQIQQLSESSFAHKQTKIKRVLSELARGESLHRFQAERLGDHCLHSTVAKIEGYGIEVAREWIAVPGYAGHATRVCRYWLTNESKERARILLGWKAWRDPS